VSPNLPELALAVLPGLVFRAWIRDEEHLLPSLTRADGGWSSRLVFSNGHLDLSVLPRMGGRWSVGLVWIGQGEIFIHVSVLMAVDFGTIPGAGSVRPAGALVQGNDQPPAGEGGTPRSCLRSPE